MTDGAKLVTSAPDTDDRDEKETLHTNRPVALVGVSHQHLENQESAETKSDKNDDEKNS